MKALLRHDWYVHRKRLLSFFGVYCVLMGLIFAGIYYPVRHIGEEQWEYKFLLFVVLLPMDLVVGMTAANALSHDVKSGWLTLLTAMPYTRRQIITAKAVFGGLVIAAHGVCVTVCQLIFTAPADDGLPIALEIACWETAKPLILSALLLWLTTRWHLSAAVGILLLAGVTMPALCLSIDLICVRSGYPPFMSESVNRLTNSLVTLSGSGVLLVSALLLYGLCWRLSMRTFDRRRI